jgi:hypothetical protein
MRDLVAPAPKLRVQILDISERPRRKDATHAKMYTHTVIQGKSDSLSCGVHSKVVEGANYVTLGRRVAGTKIKIDSR